ncbi:MAG: glycoside hydrolase N-terminal domain-containing protein [Pirellulales bacterium]|nr:glycoside hydrolase N-terminal domain-containing protein [Pirellulales bacterium]
MNLKAPIDRWDEAIPLGNGLTGGLLWGDDHRLKLSLDRGDLWDPRLPDTWGKDGWDYSRLRKLVAEGKHKELRDKLRAPSLTSPYPTKIPAGRLEIDLEPSRRVKVFELDLATATGRVKLDEGAVEVFFSATEPVALLRLPGKTPRCRVLAPASVEKLGYPPATFGHDGPAQWFVQPAHGDLRYAVVLRTQPAGEMTEMAIAITSTADGPDPVALGRQRTAAALEQGYTALLRPHKTWWKQFWDRSAVAVPDADIQRHYDLVQYFYGAASRRGAPPMPLQGVWTADADRLPPWRGDYHNDLNTQLTYWAYLTSGRFEQGASFIDFMWKLLPRHRRHAREFFGTSGAAVPGVMMLAGDPIGAGYHYGLSPTMGAWVAHAFYQHWRYTMDEEFLNQRAYPYCEAIAQCLEALLEPDANGQLKLPLSTSPEAHESKPEAWLTPNSNFDLALMRWLFGALVEMAEARGDFTAAAHWRDLLGRLEPLAVEGPNGPLKLSPDEPLTFTHRHHSHLLAIHPLGLLNVEGTPRDRKIIDASLEQLGTLGTQRWCGYSFAWLACLAARSDKPEMARENLRLFVDAFISRNGFHLNGDQSGKGYSGFTYRPFTLEGNFAAGQAVHEMLLQSWGGTVRVFPAVPAVWQNVAFRDLRAEGAFAVSAERRAGKTTLVRIRAEHGGQVRLRDPFGGKPVAWNDPDVKRRGDDYLCKLPKGKTLEGRASEE